MILIALWSENDGIVAMEDSEMGREPLQMNLLMKEPSRERKQVGVLGESTVISMLSCMLYRNTPLRLLV